MIRFLQLILGFILALLIASTSFAQNGTQNGLTELSETFPERPDLTINDIAGQWEIEVIDRPDHAFRGTATIPRIKGDSKRVVAETITEDKCCGGNHARVLQDSLVTIEDGEITVDSTIVRYLLRIEPVPMGYSPDDFALRWADENTLIGTANGYLPVRWIRGEVNIS